MACLQTMRVGSVWSPSLKLSAKLSESSAAQLMTCTRRLMSISTMTMISTKSSSVTSCKHLVSKMALMERKAQVATMKRQNVGSLVVPISALPRSTCRKRRKWLNRPVKLKRTSTEEHQRIVRSGTSSMTRSWISSYLSTIYKLLKAAKHLLVTYSVLRKWPLWQLLQIKKLRLARKELASLRLLSEIVMKTISNLFESRLNDQKFSKSVKNIQTSIDLL